MFVCLMVFGQSQRPWGRWNKIFLTQYFKVENVRRIYTWHVDAISGEGKVGLFCWMSNTRQRIRAYFEPRRVILCPVEATLPFSPEIPVFCSIYRQIRGYLVPQYTVYTEVIVRHLFSSHAVYVYDPLLQSWDLLYCKNNRNFRRWFKITGNSTFVTYTTNPVFLWLRVDLFLSLE